MSGRKLKIGPWNEFMGVAITFSGPDMVIPNEEDFEQILLIKFHFRN